jgi:hypothetical protein
MTTWFAKKVLQNFGCQDLRKGYDEQGSGIHMVRSRSDLKDV